MGEPSIYQRCSDCNKHAFGIFAEAYAENMRRLSDFTITYMVKDVELNIVNSAVVSVILESIYLEILTNQFPHISKSFINSKPFSYTNFF